MTTNATLLPSNVTILSVIILKHIKLENNQSHIEIIVDSETNGLKALSLNEKYYKLFKSIHNQKNAYRLETDIGDILTIDIIKNLRNKQWQLMTSHSFTHFAVQKVIESNFYFERISTSSIPSSNHYEDHSDLVSSASASKDDPNTPQVILANTALHPSPTHAPSTEQKLPEEKQKLSNQTTGSPASSSSSKVENTNSTSQHISQTGIKLEPKIDPQQITFVKPIVDTDKPKPVADPEVMAFILDKTGQTKGPYSFASRPTVAGQLSKSRKEMAVEDSVESANASARHAIERSSTIERKPSELNKVVTESTVISVRPSDYNTETKVPSRNPSPIVRPTSTTTTSTAAKSILTAAKTPTTSSYDLKSLTKTVAEPEEEPVAKTTAAGSSVTEKVNELTKKNSRLDFVVTETNNKPLSSSNSSSNNLKSGLPPKASSNNLLAKKEVEAIAALSPPPEITTTSSLSSDAVRERRPSFSEKTEEVPPVRRNSKDYSTTASTSTSSTFKSAPAAANLQPVNSTASSSTATQSKTESNVKIEEPPKSNTKSIAMKLFGGNNINDESSVTSNTSQDKGMKEKTSSSGNLKGDETSNDGTPKAAPYRRASESINKLFNKYQPKKKSIAGKEEETTASSTSTTPSNNRKMSLHQLLQKDAGVPTAAEESKEEINNEPITFAKPFATSTNFTNSTNNLVKGTSLSMSKNSVIENIPPEPVPVQIKAKSADEATVSKSASMSIEVSIPQITTHESTSSLLSDLEMTPPTSAGGKTPTAGEMESPVTPSKNQFLENLKRISQTGASGPPPASERPLSSALGRKQLSMSSIDFDMNAGDDDEFAFSGKPQLALKKKEEPVDEEHESSKTQHYSRLGSAFVSGNVLTRGRGAGRGAGGRGRGL